jgi:hypothetical protein
LNATAQTVEIMSAQLASTLKKSYCSKSIRIHQAFVSLASPMPEMSIALKSPVDAKVTLASTAMNFNDEF